MKNGFVIGSKEFSPEHRRKLSETTRNAKLGTHHTEETKQKLREFFSGRKLTDETKEKMKISQSKIDHHK